TVSGTTRCAGGFCAAVAATRRASSTMAVYLGVVIRLLYLAAYAALAALGEALVARPALLWLRGQGLVRPALPWDVPLGGPSFALAALVAAATFWLASGAALGRRPRVPQHLAFLLLLGACFGVRATAGEPHPPSDPVPPLLAGVRAIADELD